MQTPRTEGGYIVLVPLCLASRGAAPLFPCKIHKGGPVIDLRLGKCVEMLMDCLFFLFFFIYPPVNRYIRVCVYVYICPRLITVDSIWKKCSRCSIVSHSDEVLRGKCVGEDTSFIPPRDENSASKEMSFTARRVFSRRDKKKSHTRRPRRCRGGINGGTYTIVSRLNRGKRKKKEDSTERDGRNFLISSFRIERVGWK